MPDKPPTDPADHAEDFSHRYTQDLDIAAGQVMMDLGLSDNQMGARDPARNREHHSFFPTERTGGGISTAGQITVDSGVMNPELLATAYDDEAQEQWKKTRLRPRIEATIAHERAEHEYDGDHELALIAGVETTLPISHEARELLRQMERGWRGR